MPSIGPEQAIRDFLSAAGRPITPQADSGETGWRAEASSGGFDARPETVRFGKMRAAGRRRVYIVTCETQSGQRMRFICHVRQEESGVWRFDGASGGSADGAPQRRGHPWVNLGGGGWPQRFYAGGQVLEHGDTVARVRLRAANGVTLEDTLDEDAIVLFLAEDAVRLPISAELLDAAGQVVARRDALG